MPITTPNPKNFKSKLDLAKELITSAVERNIPFSAVVVDIWYTSSDLIEFTASYNRTLISVKSAILTYLFRWGIEVSFRELKDTSSFDQYQVRPQERIQRHWIVAFLAWTLAYWIKQNGCLSKILSEPPETIGECKQAVASLIVIDSVLPALKEQRSGCLTL